MRIAALSGWTSDQKHVVAASFLGWTLDAFDFFLLVFVLKDISQEFHTEITNVTIAILLTLAMRPIGAYIFGRAADRWGRRPAAEGRASGDIAAALRISVGPPAALGNVPRVAVAAWHLCGGRRFDVRRKTAIR